MPASLSGVVDTREEKRASRRRTLLEAGISLLGAENGPAVNVRAVCRSTGITERYFYELFGNRDDYVRAVYGDVSNQAREALLAASSGRTDFRTVASAAVEAFVTLMIDRPDMGRVLLLAPYREPALATASLGHMPDFFAVVASAFPDGAADDVRELVAVELVGALTALFTQFLAGTLSVDRDRLAAHCVDMLVAAAERTYS